MVLTRILCEYEFRAAASPKMDPLLDKGFRSRPSILGISGGDGVRLDDLSRP